MIHEAEVRRKLAAVANSELSLEDFAEWLDDESWDMHSDSAAGAIDLVSSIHLLLSEYGHGDIDERELRRQLLDFLGDDVSLSVYICLDAIASVRPRAWSRLGANAGQIEPSRVSLAPA